MALCHGLLNLCLFLAVGPVTAVAQAPALSGRVADPTGQPVPGVSVQATSSDRKTTQTTVTDGDGRYQLVSLPAGQYGLVFSIPNFADVRRRDVTISSSAPVRLDVTLSLAVNATVVVTGRDSFRNLADLPNPSENLVGVANAASEGAVTGRQIETRPIMRAGEVLEAVPGVVISQHSGEGKANQYYLRGFNLDHGTDFATTVAGVPVNLPTHAHGQGYSDLNFLIPELVTGVQFKKGPYSAHEGDFSAAGSANINYANILSQPIASASFGQHGWGRLFAAASPRLGEGHLLMGPRAEPQRWALDEARRLPEGERRGSLQSRHDAECLLRDRAGLRRALEFDRPGAGARDCERTDLAVRPSRWVRRWNHRALQRRRRTSATCRGWPHARGGVRLSSTG